MRKHRSFEEYLVGSLKDPKAAALYLNAVIDEDDPALLLTALADVAKAHGVSKMAGRIRLSRMGLYKSLSKTGNPEFKTLLGILRASGLRLAFKPT